jgi:hypothetical protein
MDGFTTALKTFLLAADLQVVLVVVILTRMIEISILDKRGWKAAAFWLPVVLSLLLTPAFSTTPETRWGGIFFARAVAYNAAVALVVWYILLPRIRKRYDQWFGSANGTNGAKKPNGGMPPAG